MSDVIDNRIVQMTFDNSKFNKNVKQSIYTIQDLKNALNLDDAAESFSELEKASSEVDFKPMSDALETVKVKFGLMEAFAINALMRISNKVIDLGKTLIKSLSVDNIASGWSKYEQKTANVQTLMNATGKSIDEINDQLEKLMWFSDETSYGFTDMTQALSTMVSSGGDIEKLVPLIEGVANATAFAGKGAAEFSRIMYNLNQSYSAGFLQYMDWKSVELAGASSKQLKQTLIDTAVELGKIKEGMVTINNFSESLKDRWADREVMEAAFGKFASYTEQAYAMVNAEIAAADTASEAYAILSKSYNDVYLKAAKAAQEAKTFQEAIDATKDAVSSQWMASFDYIFGNYAEAKELWTNLANTLWEVFAASGEVRNNMLKIWKDYGGRTKIIKGLSNIFYNLLHILEAVKEGFRQVFPPKTINDVMNFSDAFLEFTRNLVLNKDALNGIKNAVSFLLQPVKFITDILKVAFKIVGKFIPIGMKLLNTLFSVIGKFGDFVTKIKESIKESDAFKRIQNTLSKIFSNISSFVSNLTENIKKLFNTLKDIPWFSKLVDGLSWAFEKVKDAGKFALEMIATFLEKLADLKFDKVIDFFKSLGEGIQNVFNLITGKSDLTVETKEVVEDVTNMANGVKDAGIIVQKTVNPFVSAFNNIKNACVSFYSSLTSGNIKNGFVACFVSGWNIISPYLESAKERVSWFISNLVNLVTSLTAADWATLTFVGSIIAITIGVVKLIKNISNLMKSITGLTDNLSSLVSVVKKVLTNKFLKRDTIGTTIIKIASAVAILAGSLFLISKVPKDELDHVAIVLGAIAGGVILLGAGLTLMSRFIGDAKGIGIGLIGVAATILALISSLESLNDIVENGGFGRTWAMIGMLGAILGEILITMGIISKMSDNFSVKTTVGLIAFAVGLRLFVSTMNKVSTYSFTSIAIAIGELIPICLLLKILVKSISNLSFSKAAGVIALALGLSLLGSALMKFAESNFNYHKILKRTSDFLVVIGAIALLGLATRAAGENAIKAGISAIAMSAAILVLCYSIKKIADIGFGPLIKAAAVISSLGVVIGGLMFVSKYTGGMKLRGVLTLVIGINALVGEMMLLTLFDTKDLLISCGTLVSIMLSMGAFMVAANKVTAKAKDILGIIFTISAITTAFTVVSKFVDSKNIIETGASLTMVAIGMSVAMLAITKAIKTVSASSGLKSDKLKVVSGIMAGLALIIVAIGSFTALSSEDDWKNTIAICSGMNLAMLGMSKLLKTISGCSGFKADKVNPVLKLLIGTMGAMSIILGLLTHGISDDFSKSISASIALSLVAVSFGLLLKTISSIDARKLGEAKIWDIVNLSYSLVPMAVAIGALSQFGGEWQNMIASSASLSLCLTAFSGLVMVITKMGIDNLTLKQVGLLLLLTLSFIPVAGALLLIGNFASESNNIIESAIGMSICIAAISLVASLITAIPIGGALSGVAALAILITGIAGIFALLGLLASWDTFKNLVNGGLTFLIDIFRGIGEAFGTLISGFGVGITSGLPEIGENLTLFMANANGFFEMLGKLDDKALIGVGKLADVIGALTGDAILNGLASFFMGDGYFEKFGLILESIAPHIVKFSDSVKGMDSDAVQAASTCGLMIAAFAQNIPNEDGFLSYIVGDNKMDEFFNKLPDVGRKLCEFGTIAGGIDSSAVETASNCASIVIAFAQNIPNEGGLLSYIVGDNNMDEFFNKLPSVAEKLVDFSDNAEGINEKNVSVASNCASMIVAFAQKVPNEGGVVSWFTGDNKIDEFFNKLPEVGRNLAKFSFNAQNVNEDAVTRAVNCASMISGLAQNLPNEGGFVSLFTGDNSLGTFSGYLPDFGFNLKSFAKHIVGIDQSSVENAIACAEMISGFANTIDGQSGWDMLMNGNTSLTVFGQDIANFGISLAVFNFAISNIDANKVETIIDCVDMLVKAAKKAQDVDSDGLEDILEVLTDAVEDGFLEGITDVTEQITDISIALIDGFVNEIESNIERFTTEGQNCLRAYLDGLTDPEILNGYTEKLAQSGENIIAGISQGITDNLDELGDVGESMGLAVLNKFNWILGIHSPSWEFRKSGVNIVQGVNEGIESYADTASNKMGRVAKEMVTSFNDEMSELDIKKPVTDSIEAAQDEVNAVAYEAGCEAAQSNIDGYKETISSFNASEYYSTHYKNIDIEAKAKVNGDWIDKIDTKLEEYAKKIEDFTGGTIKATDAYASLKDSIHDVSFFDGILNGEKGIQGIIDELGIGEDGITENGTIENIENALGNIGDSFVDLGSSATKGTTEAKTAVEKLSKAFDAANITDVLTVVGDNFAKTFITSQKHMFETGAFAITKELGNGLTEFEYDTEKQTEVAMSFMSKFVTKLYEASVTAEESIQNVKKVVGSNLQEASKELHKHGYSLTEIATMYETTEDAVLDALGVTRSEYDKALTAYAMKTKGITESSQNQCEELAETANDLSGNISDTSDELVVAVDKAGNAFEIFDKQAIYNLDAVQEKFGSFVSNIENKISGYLNLFEKIEKDPEKILEAEQERAENTVSGTELLADMKENLNNYQDYVNKVQAIFTKGGEAITDSFKDIILGLDPSDTKLDSFLQMSQEQLEEAIAITSSSDAIKSGFANQITSSLITTGSVFRDSFFEPLNAEESYEVFNAFATGGVEALNNAFRIATGRSEVSAEVGKAVDEGIKDGIEVNAVTVESSVTTLGNGITDAYEQVCGEEIWVDNGKYIAEGLANGISSNSVLATSQARKLGTSINSAFRMETAIASPSKVFAENGMYIDEGLAVGIERYSKIATAAASNMADDVTEAGSTRLTTVWTDDMDLNPVITPTLDLSKVTEGLSQLHAMFNNEKLSVNENGQNDANTSGNTYTFTQNNYSPKSLSRADIYRQTKNQFSQLKGALG